MALSRLSLISILLFLGAATRSHGQGQDEVTIYPLRTYACEDADNLLDGNFDMRVDDDDDKYINIDFKIDEDVTEAWKVTFKVDSWNNGEWQEDFYNDGGNICNMLNKYMSTIWQNIRAQSMPPITGDCSIKAGTYSVKNFKVSRDEYTLPTSKTGTFKIFTTLFDEYNTLVWCQVLEVEMNK